MNLRTISKLMLGLALVAFTATGCKKDECKDKNCGNGSCVDGNCVCNTGYEGSECGTQTRAKFIGSYTGTFSCSGGSPGTINMTITNSSAGITSVVMSDGFDNWVCTVSGSTLNIANQTISGGNTIQGSGQLVGNILTLNLNISGTTCTYSGTKQ
ncbi:MAG TPA: hypothetical protein PKE21_13400 [Flavobacteriales bacterium]|nr:hypothetical protein [Flavobacteriales bacterium]HMR28471.1 hypothetical protein [Flavobacteriales bacterium]